MDTNSVKFFKDMVYKTREDVSRPILIAWKLITPENYGNLLRLADTIGCFKVYFVIDAPALSLRKIRKTAGESYKSVDFEFVSEKELIEVIPRNYSLVALETATNSTNLFDSELPDHFAVAVGNERHGIDLEFLNKCDQSIHIPITGNCTSLNVSHAATVVLYEWLRQKLVM